MKITITNTDQIVEINKVPARVWIGKTDSGVEVECLITRIAVRRDKDHSQFDRELAEEGPPYKSECFPLRMIL